MPGRCTEKPAAQHHASTERKDGEPEQWHEGDEAEGGRRRIDAPVAKTTSTITTRKTAVTDRRSRRRNDETRGRGHHRQSRRR